MPEPSAHVALAEEPGTKVQSRFQRHMEARDAGCVDPYP